MKLLVQVNIAGNHTSPRGIRPSQDNAGPEPEVSADSENDHARCSWECRRADSFQNDATRDIASAIVPIEPTASELAARAYEPETLAPPSQQPPGPQERRPLGGGLQHLASGTDGPASVPGGRTLRVLQYNVENSLDHVMASLMRDERILDYEVICIQEPWVLNASDQLSTTHFPNEAKQHFDLFWPSVPAPFTPKVCTFVRKDLSKQLAHFSQHILSIYVSEGNRNFCVHVYNPPQLNHGVHDLRG